MCALTKEITCTAPPPHLGYNSRDEDVSQHCSSFHHTACSRGCITLQSRSGRCTFIMSSKKRGSLLMGSLTNKQIHQDNNRCTSRRALQFHVTTTQGRSLNTTWTKKHHQEWNQIKRKAAPQPSLTDRRASVQRKYRFKSRSQDCWQWCSDLDICYDNQLIIFKPLAL